MDFLDLKSLQIFVAVCDKGSMTGAGKTIGISQSAVSQSIREMERFIGVPLIDRSMRPLSPTPAGSVLYQRGRHILAEAREAHVLTWQYGTGTLPKLRIGLNFTLSRTFTTRLVDILQHQSSPPDIVIWNSGDSDHTNALINREIDFIISADDLDHLDGFERHPIVTESFLLLCPADFFAGDEGIDFERLKSSLPLIRYSARTYVGQHIERHLARIRLDMPRHIEVESPESVVEMVGERMGWSILTPLNLAYAKAEKSKVRALPFPGPGFNRHLTLIARETEFSSIPKKLANISRDIIDRYLIPELVDFDSKMAVYLSTVRPSEDVSRTRPGSPDRS